MRYKCKWMGRVTVLMLTCIAMHDAAAQYRFRHLTTRDGLIQGSQYYFLEDRDGLMWMTTQAGLNRFDGQQFKSFVHDDRDTTSISKGEVRGLAEAPNGDVWVGTEVALSRYVRSTGRFQHYFAVDSLGKKVLSQHQAIYADDSTVWFLNDLQGLVQLNYRTASRKVHYPDAHFSYEFRTDIVHFDTDRQRVWLKQPEGLICYDAKSTKVTHYFTGKKDDQFGAALSVYSIFSPDHQTVWLTTNKGLVKINNDRYEVYQVGVDLSKNLVFSMTTTPDGILWLGTYKSGLIGFDPVQKRVVKTISRNQFSSNSLASDHVSKLFTDSRGVLWVNVEPLGVDLIFSDSLALGHYDDNLLNPDDFNNASVRGISQDHSQNLWIGTTSDGIRKITPDGNITRQGKKNGFLEAGVRGIVADKAGALWISTLEGLMMLPKDAKAPQKILFTGPDLGRSNYIRGVKETEPGYYIVATMSGLFGYSKQSKKLLTTPEDSFSGALFYDPAAKQLWAGRADKDMRCYSFQGDTLHPVYDALPGYSILAFLADTTDDGRPFLWLGTDNGLIQFDHLQNKIIKVFSTHDGLPDHVVYSVIRDDSGGLWMSTNKGLVSRNGKGEFQRIRESEGIEFNSYAAFKTHNGTLYFGSPQGVFYLRPEVMTEPSARGLRIVGVMVNELDYAVISYADHRKVPQFSYLQNDLSIELAALDYLAEVPPLYEYRFVEGGDDEWISNGSYPHLNFRNLPPGTYRMAFRALDSHGFYTETEEFAFVITPPYWQRWWFRSLVALVLLTVLYGIVRGYVARQRLEQQAITRRIVDAQESERLRIAMDIHDDVNNTLAAAKGYLQHRIEVFSEEYTQRCKALIQKATDDLRSITHDLMPVDFSKYRFEDVIEQKALEWDRVHTVEFVYILAGEPVKLRPEAELIAYRIVLEIVQNIVKHSQAGQAIIQLIYHEDSLAICIEDNGRGMASTAESDTNTGGIGLKNVYSRAEYLKAAIELNSDPKGVLIQITIPYDDNQYHSGSPG